MTPRPARILWEPEAEIGGSVHVSVGLDPVDDENQHDRVWVVLGDYRVGMTVSQAEAFAKTVRVAAMTLSEWQANGYAS